jgi:hypothetical protein
MMLPPQKKRDFLRFYPQIFTLRSLRVSRFKPLTSKNLPQILPKAIGENLRRLTAEFFSVSVTSLPASLRPEP